jgi:hypothetical protein
MSPCNIGQEKIFVNTRVAGGGVYLLMAGEITLEKHKEFENIIKEVDWFHLKEYKK